MKWLRPNDSSANYQDRRGRISGRGLALGGGIGGIVIVLASLFFGVDLTGLMQVADNVLPGSQTEQVDPSRVNENEEFKVFTLRVFNSCNDVWTDLFNSELQRSYAAPTLVTFTDQVQSRCGGATSEVGPFYCPADQTVYIDLDFFNLLASRFKAPGDLAMAYVTAHEVGHHVQNLLGISDKLHQQQGRVSQEAYNRASVQLELQADYLAGVWAYHAQRLGIILIEPGDLEDALTAANAIGDDTLQKEAQGYAVPDSFTHGTSAQRMQAFRSGFETGNLDGASRYRF
ncbi:neutral zinc metallopeptidase [Porphyromonas uenonis]|uniref:Putative neutral zinc metallopeptidase n=1 Tax=Porphyromonas uenonis 60-3 TaxID=596327 RepID=C2MDL9_9PORP|nr:neutral zinc metallopeptidase [Porphyromonas uenonis]EEK16174.1 putative neutral zinc metallopeptidase [Porphyromonas uenonis 60-3]